MKQVHAQKEGDMCHIHTYFPYTQTQRRGIYMPYTYTHKYHTQAQKGRRHTTYMHTLHTHTMHTPYTKRETEKKREHISTHTTEKEVYAILNRHCTHVHTQISQTYHAPPHTDTHEGSTFLSSLPRMLT